MSKKRSGKKQPDKKPDYSYCFTELPTSNIKCEDFMVSPEQYEMRKKRMLTNRFYIKWTQSN